MNVPDLIRAACYELNIPAPTGAVTTATDAGTLQLRNLFYSVGRELRNKRYWPQLKHTHTITLTSGRAAYPLPEDFFAAIPFTHTDRTNHREMLGPVSDQYWNERLYEYASSETYRAYRIFGPDDSKYSLGGQFKVDPTPTSEDVISFDYISKSWISPPRWILFTPIGFSQYRSASGNIYRATVTGTNGLTPPTHTSGTAVNGSATYEYITAPYEAILTDDDFSLFDDNLMILGLKSALTSDKGLADRFAIQFQQAANQAFMRWSHMPKLSMAQDGIPYRNVPEGGFG